MPTQTQTQTASELIIALLAATPRRPAQSSEFGAQGMANNPLARTTQARPRLT